MPLDRAVQMWETTSRKAFPAVNRRCTSDDSSVPSRLGIFVIASEVQVAVSDAVSARIAAADNFRNPRGRRHWALMAPRHFNGRLFAELFDVQIKLTGESLSALDTIQRHHSPCRAMMRQGADVHGFRDKAIVVGADGMGAIVPLADTLRTYGFRRVTGLVDRPSAYDKGNRHWLELVEVPLEELTDPRRLQERLLGEGLSANVPALCVYDGLLLPYARAIAEGTPYASSMVPTEALLRARSKPHARLACSTNAGHSVRWRVLSPNAQRQRAWDSRSGPFPDTSKRCFVKPATGFQSEHVRRSNSNAHVEAAANAIRTAIAESRLWDCQPVLSLDDLELDPRQDVLLEEAFNGPEYTVDGVISNGVVHCAVQHKELVYRAPFHGDGFVVSPPDPMARTAPELLDGRVVEGSLQGSRHSQRGHLDFEKFISGVLAALKLDNWVFHAEVIDHDERELKLVELNPRIPGGLLAASASLHLGVDLLDAIVRRTLGLPVPTPIRDVTAHVPLYADRVGTIADVIGVPKPSEAEGVHAATVFLSRGAVVTHRMRENYAGFIVFRAATHAEVRERAAVVLRGIKVVYAGDPK